jgi:hypothetical protein
MPVPAIWIPASRQSLRQIPETIVPPPAWQSFQDLGSGSSGNDSTLNSKFETTDFRRNKKENIWDTSSPQRGREDSARGFNPGNPVPRRRALKGRQRERAKQPTNQRIEGNGTPAAVLSLALSGRTICLDGSPGLKPWAKSCSPSGAMNRPKSSLT